MVFAASSAKDSADWEQQSSDPSERTLLSKKFTKIDKKNKKLGKVDLSQQEASMFTDNNIVTIRHAAALKNGGKLFKNT